MNKVRIELNSDGIQELLKSSEMQSVLTQYANDMNLLFDGVKVYKKRAVVNEKKGDNNANREDH